MGGGDDKALSGRVVHVVDHLIRGEGLDVLLHEEFNISHLETFFGCFWLIQSQSQTGTASAKALKNQSQGFPRTLLQQFQQGRAGAFGNFHDDLLGGVFI